MEPGKLFKFEEVKLGKICDKYTTWQDKLEYNQPDAKISQARR
jgi:hypothetical protein